MSYNYCKLRGKIIERYRTQAEFANAMGLSEHTISVKLNGKTEWKQSEIMLAADLLGLGTAEITSYFFTT